MSSEVDICNIALDFHGIENPIASMDDARPAARVVRRHYFAQRDAEIRSHRWKFSMARITLTELANAPAFGYQRQFQLPSDYIRADFIGDAFVGLSGSDYRAGEEADYQIEGGLLLTNLPSPLHFRYARRVENTGLFDPLFVMVLAMRIAYFGGVALTQSTQKRDDAMRAYAGLVDQAVMVEAIERAPEVIADDAMVMTRI